MLSYDSFCSLIWSTIAIDFVTFTSFFVQEWQYFQELAELNIAVYAQLISSLEKAVFC